MDKGNSTGWLNAWITLKNGDQPMARESLASYMGRTLADNEEVTTDLLLRLWDTPLTSLEGFDLAFCFPILPTSITGLPHEVVRLPYGPSVLPLNASPLPDRGVSVSAEAGESTDPCISC